MTRGTQPSRGAATIGAAAAAGVFSGDPVPAREVVAAFVCVAVRVLVGKATEGNPVAAGFENDGTENEMDGIEMDGIEMDGTVIDGTVKGALDRQRVPVGLQ